MAWRMSYKGWDSGNALGWLQLSPDLSSLWEVDDEVAFRDLDAPLTYEDRDPRPNARRGRPGGRAPSIYAGLFIPERLVDRLPKRALLPKRFKRLPDLVQGPHWMLSDRFRDVIEAVAPGEAQFFPLTVTDYETREPVEGYGTYHLLNAIHYRSPIEMFEGTNVPVRDEFTQHGNPKRRYETLYNSFKYTYGGQGNMQVNRAAAAGRHLWRTFTAKRGELGTDNLRLWYVDDGVFLSDELAAAIKRAKINNVKLEQFDEV